MKTPDNSKPLPSALDSVHFIGSFPKQRNTVTAEVLMQLLEGERISGMDAVFAANTTRLAAKIHHLINGHSWDISHTDEMIQTKDGRITEIRRYHLSKNIIAAAMQAGGLDFCESVREAREALLMSPQQLPVKPQKTGAE
jgi:hypothetical protein